MLRSRRHLTADGLRRSTAWILALVAAAGCGPAPWSDGQKSEAVRMCRGPTALAPVDVFREDERAFATFMCECQVEHLSARLPHASLLSPFHLDEVNGALADARAECLQRHRRRHAGMEPAGAGRARRTSATGAWWP